MRFERFDRAAFSRLEIGVVLANLILLVLLLIPAFRPAKPLELVPEVAPRSLPAAAPGDAKAAVKNG
jgi:hypothetical protein